MRKIIICLLVCVNAYSQSSLLTDINGYWKLDESSGYAIDATGYNNGTVTGATQGVSGHIGNAYSFNGSSQFITLPDNARIQLTGNLSIGAWVKVISYESSFIAVVGGETGAASLVVRDNGAIQFVIVNVSEADQSTSTISVNNWHYILVTFNTTANTGTYYINGSPAGTFTQTANVTNGSSSNIIGKYTSSSTLRNFNGLIDEVGMWSRVLTTDEASSLYNGISYPFVVETRIGKNTYRNNVLKDRYRKVGSSYVQKNLFRKKGKPYDSFRTLFNIIYHEDWSSASLDANWTQTEVENYFSEDSVEFAYVNWFNPPTNTQSCASIENDTLNGQIIKSLKISHPYLDGDQMMYGFDVSIWLGAHYDELYCSYPIYHSKNYSSTAGGKFHGLKGSAFMEDNACPTGYTDPDDDGFAARTSFEQAGEIYPYYYVYSPDIGYCPYAHAASGNTDCEQVDTAFMVYGNHQLITTRLVMNSFTGTTPNTDGILELFIDNYVVFQQNNLILRDYPGKGIDCFHFANWHGGTGIQYKPTHTVYTKTPFADVYESPGDPTWGTRDLHTPGTFLNTPYVIQNRDLHYDHLVTSEGSNQSTGYGSVAAGFDETWLIDAGAGNTVTIDFTAGAIGGGDRLHIIDGNQIDDRYIEVKEDYVGDITVLNPYTSSGRYLFVRYSSDYDGGYTGVQFTVTFN